MAISLAHAPIGPEEIKDGVKIIWQGKRIARLVFASGKVVEFHEDPTDSAPANDTSLRRQPAQ
ncbi:MAG TPA: hypothetical protein VF234_10250 [Limnochordia bacterium]